MLLGASNFNDVIIAGFVFLGVAVTAGVTLYTARQVRHTKRIAEDSNRIARDTNAEVKSPNGESTATAIYEIRKQIVGLTVIGSELKASVKDLQISTADHARSDLAFQEATVDAISRLHQHLNLEQEV